MTTQQHRVAVIDSDELFAETLSDLLIEEGYRVRIFQNMPSALQQVSAYRPDLIILDLHYTPSGASWKVLFDFRSNPGTSAIPLIVSSADVILVREHAEQLAQLGVVVQEKPFMIEELLAKIDYMLGIG